MTFAPSAVAVEHVEVLIIAAGISGIGLAWYLQHRLPAKRWAILESRASIGGTWDLFRYPGILSDSDLYTFGYAFKPWRGNSIATGEAILDYPRDVAQENGIKQRIHLCHRVTTAAWSSTDGCWTVTILCGDTLNPMR